MNIQIAKFPDGGFVIHKIKVPTSKMTVSAWFDKDGKLLDAEFQNERKVKRGGPAWMKAKSIGLICKE